MTKKDIPLKNMAKDMVIQKTPTGQLTLTIPKAIAQSMGIDKKTVVSLTIAGKKEILLRIR